MRPLGAAKIKASRALANANSAGSPLRLRSAVMKTIDDWLDEYGESHLHPTNKTIHRIAVPVIALDVLGLVHALPVEGAAVAVVIAALAYYARLSAPLALGMAALAAAGLALLEATGSRSARRSCRCSWRSS
jgi:uncharacterized membrane protein YGL010W